MQNADHKNEFLAGIPEVQISQEIASKIPLFIIIPPFSRKGPQTGL